MVDKNNVFKSKHLFINYNCREQMVISPPQLTVFPRPRTLLGICLATLDWTELCFDLHASESK